MVSAMHAQDSVPPPVDLGAALEARVFQSASGASLPYRLLTPQKIDPQRRYPLVVFLHGAGERGADNVDRLGPPRATQLGLLSPARMKAGMWAAFALAMMAGIYLVYVGGWPIVAVGLASIAAAIIYTGGPWPIGYHALGDAFTFVFFGLVATVGTVWLQSESIPQEAWIAGAGVGLFAVAVLIANNTRDIPTDRLAGKRTLSVRIGDRASRILYVVCVLLPFAVPAVYGAVHPGMLLVWLVLIIVIPSCVITLWARTARELIIVLGLTSLAALAYGVLLGIAFAF